MKLNLSIKRHQMHIANYCRRFLKLPEERKLLLYGFLFGLLLVVITPPIAVVDEENHFFRAYEIAHGNVITDPVKNNSAGYGAVLPANLVDYIHKNKREAIYVHESKFEFFGGGNHAEEKPDYGKTKTVAYNGSAVYSPVIYAPQALGVKLADFLQLSIKWYVYLGRLFNVIAFIALCYIAVRLAPIGKTIILFVSMLPMTLYQAASLSADAATIGSCLVMFALLARIIYDRKALEDKRMMAGIAITLFLVGQAKTIYMLLFLLPFLYLLFFRTKIKLKKRIIILTLTIALPLLAAILWNLAVQSISRALSNTVNIFLPVGVQASPLDQLYFILGHPFRYIYDAIYTVLFVNSLAIYGGLVGRFGWVDEDVTLPIWSIVLVYLQGLLAFKIDRENFQKSALSSAIGKVTALRSIITIDVLLVLFGFLTLFYLTINAIGSHIILGVQGRYFIPLIPFVGLAFMLGKSKLITVNSTRRASGYFHSLICLNFITMVFIIVRQYYF